MIIDRFPEIRSLPLRDKHQLVLEILGEIDEEEFPTPDWVLELVNERIAAYEADPEANSVPWEEVKQRLLNSRRSKQSP